MDNREDSRSTDDIAITDDRDRDPVAREALISRGPGLLEAQSYSFAVMGVISASIYLVAALLMVVYVRRTNRSDTVS